jgi:hypothetical protein
LLGNNEKGKAKTWKLDVPQDSAKELKRMKGMLAINYCDSKSFMLLSTVPPDNFKWDPRHKYIPFTGVTVPRRRSGTVIQQPAPNLVAVYNSEMNGADVFDASWNRCEIGFLRKWPVVFFFVVLDFIVENSRIAFNWFAKKKLTPADFQLQLADELLRSDTRERIARLAASVSDVLQAPRRMRDSPLPQLQRPAQRQRGPVCRYGALAAQPRTCTAKNCQNRLRNGCTTHKYILCIDCYAYLHVSSTRTGKKGKSIPFSID